VAVATVIALALTVFGTPAGAAHRPRRPDHWDQRLLKYVKFVERERGLRFEHPVPAHFLADKKFKRLLRGDSKPTKKDKELEKQTEGELEALGLVSAGVDFGKTSEDIQVEGTLGFYDTDTKELYVRGRSLKSLNAQVTVVHELTHALQDQHFDLDKLTNHATEGSESFALDFLVEGDATFVEDTYVQGLSEKQQNRYYGEIDDFTQGATSAAEPAYALDVFLSAPYVLGEGYVFALDPDGGTSGRNRAFRHPPKTEEVLIDPLALHEHQREKKVRRPKLESGEKKLYGPEQFGVIALYLMLATRLDVRTALEAVTGWGGDNYVGFRSDDGHACVRINVTGDTRKDTNQYEDALREWQAALPAGAVEVKRSGSVVTVTACQAPDVKAPTVAKFDSAFYNVLGQRVFIVLDLVKSGGLALRDAMCVGDRVSTDPTVVAAFDQAFAEDREPTAADYATLDRAYSNAYRPCGVTPP
jgi:hypothetical protein